MNPEAIRAYWRYTPREAEFLILVMNHGGYFVRRQFNQFCGTTRGRPAQNLAEKLRRWKHARLVPTTNGTEVYHVSNQRLYAAIDQENSRFRQSRSPFTARQKLMVLDLILAHPNDSFLATENDRIGWFLQVGIDLSLLPQRPYNGFRKPDAAQPREACYFADRMPILIRDGQCCFCYIDEGPMATVGFRTWLRSYTRLLAALPAFTVLYCAAEALRFERARTIFEESYAPRLVPDLDPEARQMLAHFRDRLAVEQKRFGALGVAGIERYRSDSRRFAGETIDRKYDEWKILGDRFFSARIEPGLPQGKGVFSTYLLPEIYTIFGSIARANCA